MSTILHLAPHPDDESIAAPATLMAIREAGWRVVNLAVSLGRDDGGEKTRREGELREACARAGFDLLVADLPLRGALTGPPGPLHTGDLVSVQRAIEEAVADAVAAESPSILVAPSPHDGHPGHEIVGRAAVAVCERLGDATPVLWLWGLWADLPFPTILFDYDERKLTDVLHCLDAYSGELERNDYRRMVSGRAQMNASLGPERVFGFGSSAKTQNVDLLCEVLLEGGEWRLGSPRRLDPLDPLGSSRTEDRAPEEGLRVVSEWLHSPSLWTVYGRPGE